MDAVTPGDPNGSLSSASQAPPVYIPSIPIALDTLPAPLPAADSLSITPSPPNSSLNIDVYTFTPSRSDESLPVYSPQAGTEPRTLARGLWWWGWALPFLWIIGMCILWIPLKAVEEESDPEKAQKLQEMIHILRKTELKYAKRCSYGVIGWFVFITLVIVIAVLVLKLA